MWDAPVPLGALVALSALPKLQTLTVDAETLEGWEVDAYPAGSVEALFGFLSLIHDPPHLCL